jgi:hypothetical protein
MTLDQRPTPGVAIASLVLGILGLVMIGPLGAIPAIICGHLARSRIVASQGALQGEGIALAGLILGYVGVGVMILMIPMCAAIALPACVKARATARRHACVNNLRMMDHATERWAAETRADPGETPAGEDLSRYFKDGRMPVCPAGGEYTLHAVGTDPECSMHGPLGQADRRRSGRPRPP